MMLDVCTVQLALKECDDKVVFGRVAPGTQTAAARKSPLWRRHSGTRHVLAGAGASSGPIAC